MTSQSSGDRVARVNKMPADPDDERSFRHTVIALASKQRDELSSVEVPEHVDDIYGAGASAGFAQEVGFVLDVMRTSVEVVDTDQFLTHGTEPTEFRTRLKSVIEAFHSDGLPVHRMSDELTSVKQLLSDNSPENVFAVSQRSDRVKEGLVNGE